MKPISKREIIEWLKTSAIIFSIYSVMMCGSSATFRPQEDVLARYMEPVPEAPVVAEVIVERDARAEALAKVVYGTALYNSEEQQKAVMWCIINRCESGLYPNTVEEVCRQPQQWMGYSGENPVMDRLYDMGCEVLAAWESGGSRNLPKDCLWFDWHGTESITFRTDFEGKGNTWVVE